MSTMKFAFQVPFCLVYIPARKYLKSAIRQLTKADLRVKILAKLEKKIYRKVRSNRPPASQRI